MVAVAVRTFEGVVVEVHDGDTFLLHLDLGFYVYTQQWLRLKDFYAPEQWTAEGKQFTARIKPLLEGREVLVEVEKLKWSFRRFVASATLACGVDLKVYLEQELERMREEAKA